MGLLEWRELASGAEKVVAGRVVVLASCKGPWEMQCAQPFDWT